MPAISPYAPPRRNPFLHHPAVPPPNRSRRTLAIGFCLALVVRYYYWNKRVVRQDHDTNETTTARTAATTTTTTVLPATLQRLVEGLLQQREPGLLSELKTSLRGLVDWVDRCVLLVANPSMQRTLSSVDERCIGNGNYHQHQHHRDTRTTHIQTATVNHNQSDHAADAATTTTNHQLQMQQQVLKFWFGQYTPDEAQKKLWMIAEQSKTLRATVDKEITMRFGDLLRQLVSCKNSMWKEWTREVYGYMGKIAAIIVLDQFSRHILRYYQQQQQKLQQTHDTQDITCTNLEEVLSSLPEQSELDQIALQVAQLLIQEHAMEIQSGMISVNMYIFSLMPFRHAHSLQTVKYVQSQVEVANDLMQQKDSMLRRFRKATNRRLAVLQDQARSVGDANNSNNNKTDYTDQDILECFPFQPDDESLMPLHPVHQTIRAFLTQRGIHPVDQKDNGDSNNDVSPTPIIISLSGGVDSMVIASVLAHMNRSCGYKLKLAAVHIDYANRPESAAEAAYVQRYCKQLGVQYHCRRVGEVTRGVTARNEYERISRDIRYSFYRDTINESLRELPNGDIGEVGVMLGHHRGDLRENVLSNAHKGCGPLDLSGMTAVSRNDGVTLYRPLLPLEKTFVYDYAHLFGVPYFKDTTPQWSTRGKLRNKLLPLLEEIYGEGSMNNLSTLAVESDECRSLVHGTVLKPFLDQVLYKPMGIQFKTAPWKEQGLFFWKFVLRATLHSAGLGMFSDKSVKAFLERVHASDLREGWLQCRKDYGVYLRKDGTVFVFYPSSFPWRNADAFPCLGEKVEYGDENCTEVGPWKITVEDLANTLERQEANECLETRAIFSLEDLMEGSIQYYLEVPTQTVDGSTEVLPLVFTKFKRSTRPAAWKGVDLKIQEALPLVGINEKALNAVNLEDNGTHLAKVTIRLDYNNRSMMSY